jgi:hypothetical protein
VSQVVFDCPYTEERNRGTTAIRVILAIPHLVLYGAWAAVARVCAVIQWFIVVFTGQRQKGLWDFAMSAEAYGSRVLSYTGLLHDVYPPFLTEQGAVPSTYSLEYPTEANRLTVGLRLIWVIPAAILAAVLAVAAFVVLIVSWFTILFTGKHPRGMFDFLVKCLRYAMQTQAYLYLLTDTYPKY